VPIPYGPGSEVIGNKIPLARFMLSPLSAFDGAGYDTFDDVLLRDQIEHHHRDDCQNQHRHHSAPINGTIAALKILNRNRNRFVLFQIQYQIRQQIVIPDPHGFQNADRNISWLHNRQNDAEKRSQRVGAVDHGRFFNFQRNALDKSAEHEDGQSRAEAEIDDYQPKRIAQLENIGDFAQGEHDHLERHNHAEQAEEVNPLGHNIDSAADIPCAHRSADQDHQYGTDGDNHTVERSIGKIGFVDALHIIFERHKAFSGRQCKWITVDIRLFLERINQNN